MSDNPKISVIVPVYNAEKYLRRCIDSILNQTFTDFEVLLINDGSTDSSGAICDEYAKQDSRVRVFHKENGGVSSARQLGVDKAVGIYSIHIDSDDWISEEMLFAMYNSACENNSDIVLCDYIKESKNNSFYYSYVPSGEYGRDLYKDLMLRVLPGSCCNKLVKHSLYSKYKIEFPRNINFGEDWFVNCLIAYYAKKISHIKQGMYHYVQNNNSIMHTLDKSDYIGRFKAVEKVKNALNLEDKDPYIIYYILMLKLECYNSKLFSLNEIIEIEQDNNYLISSCYLLKLKHRIIIEAIINKNKFILLLYEFAKKVNR